MRVCVLVNGLPGSGKTTVGRTLARDLDLPLFSKDRVKDHLVEAAGREVAAERLSAWGNDALWALVGSSPTGWTP